MSELPNGWASTDLGYVFMAVVGGGTPARNVPEYFDGNIPWFTVKDMKSLKPRDAQEHITEAAIAASATNLIPADSLIIATRIALGRAMRPTVACAINQDLKALVLGQGMNHDFLLYWIGAHERVIQDLGSGTTVSGIRLEALHGLPLKLPPSKEQTRIVEKLEELLSDLDAGVAELKAAQKKLAQYRQSLLKAAVTGELTSKWRAARALSESDKAENGQQLLQRILTERRARWEAKQLAKFKEQGKTPPKDWQKKYPDPVQPDTTGLPKLPEEWVWTSLDMLIVEGPQNGLYLPGDRYGSGTPILRIDDYQIGWHRNRAALNLVNVDEATRNTYALTVGDLVINRVNSMTHLGKSLLITDVLEGTLFESNMMRSGLSVALSGEFVAYYLGSEIGRSRLIQDAKWAVNQASINQQDVRRTPVPLPPAAEQVMVAATLREQLGAATEQGLAIELALKQSTAQRQNILRAAFSGQLVPQDPNDEPASVLLARIRAERAQREAVKKPRGRKPKDAA